MTTDRLEHIQWNIYMKKKDTIKFMEFLSYSLVYFHLYKNQKVKKYTWSVQVGTVVLRLISYHPLRRQLPFVF